MRVCFSIVLLWLVLASDAVAERRIALVVGNAGYRHISRLENSANDARLMAAALRDLGFALVGGDARVDLDKAGFDEAVRAFGRELAGADVALFYYAGHGVQVRGENYLVPVGANPAREADIDFEMLNTALVLRQMEAAGTRLNVIILDACRNNPFGGRGLRATSSGLAQMQAPEGTLISFATQPGNVALDGVGRHSPYTEALATTIRRPGLDLFQTFNQVGLAVKRATAGAQQPWVSSSPIAGSFYFAGEQSPPASAEIPRQPPAPTLSREAERAWGVTKDTTSIAVLEDFVRQFGETPYGSMARARLQELRNVQQGKQQVAIAREPSSPQQHTPDFGDASSRASPSFDCATHRSVDEIAICGSARLSLLDRRLDALYAAVRGRVSKDRQLRLRDEQRNWLKRRAACVGDEACLIGTYEERIADLQSWR